jgi:hypothetical protein
MEDTTNQTLSREQAVLELFDFAVDREDLKTLLAALPEEVGVERGRIEYELAILRIISVGWSISYFLEHSPHKDRLALDYWKAVQEFSRTVSESARLMVGKDIDYFQIVKDRLNAYVEAMRLKPHSCAPAVVIGPEFARACGDVEDVHAVLTGAKMFIAVVTSVKEYLDRMGI